MYGTRKSTKRARGHRLPSWKKTLVLIVIYTLVASHEHLHNAQRATFFVIKTRVGRHVNSAGSTNNNTRKLEPTPAVSCIHTMRLLEVLKPQARRGGPRLQGTPGPRRSPGRTPDPWGSRATPSRASAAKRRGLPRCRTTKSRRASAAWRIDETAATRARTSSTAPAVTSCV